MGRRQENVFKNKLKSKRYGTDKSETASQDKWNTKHRNRKRREQKKLKQKMDKSNIKRKNNYGSTYIDNKRRSRRIQSLSLNNNNCTDIDTMDIDEDNDDNNYGSTYIDHKRRSKRVKALLSNNNKNKNNNHDIGDDGIGKIFCYKIKAQNRDSPCFQDGLASLSTCRPKMRKKAKRGDLVIGIGSKRGGNNGKLLSMMKISDIIASKDYFNSEQATKYESRRDCVYYAFPDGVVLYSSNLYPGFHNFKYWMDRISFNYGDDHQVLLADEYYTFFKSNAGPLLSRDFYEYLCHKTRDYGLPEKHHREVLNIWRSYSDGIREYEEECNPNQYDHDHPTALPLLKEMAKSKTLPHVSADDILQKLESIVFPKKNGIGAQSFTLGLVSTYNELLRSKASSNHWDLFEMLMVWMEQEYRKELDVHYSSICVNKNFACQKHHELNNKNLSYIIGMGNYSGGELNIDGTAYDIKNTLFTLDNKLQHYIQPFIGTFYTITYFTHQLSDWID